MINKIAITGTLPKGRKEYVADITLVGDIFSKSVTKDTTILVIGSHENLTNKAKVAKERGVKIMSSEEFDVYINEKKETLI